MKTSLEHLPENKCAELRQVVEIIRDEIRSDELEMIILFGSHARGDWVEDAYVGEDGIYYKYRSDFDILAVVAHRRTAEKSGKWHRTRARIRKTASIHTPVTVIAHEIRFINKRLQEGNYFFTDIQKEGIQLFDSGRWQLAEPRKLTPAERKERASEDFELWFESANNFMLLFQSGFEKGIYKEAVFLLHQVAEKLYTTFLLVYTGYKPKTHDLAELGEHVSVHEPVLVETVFPNKTEEEYRLFELLRSAYVDARYNKRYSITHEELVWLSERVDRLKELLADVCQKRISRYAGVSGSKEEDEGQDNFSAK